MSTLEKQVMLLKESNEKPFNIENLYHKADDDRFYAYLYNYVLSYVTDDSVIFDAIEERKFYTPKREIVGVFEKNNKVSCIIPERETLYDEIISIHEITHLVNYINCRSNDKTVYREIIPFFNEYEYLRQLHQFYADIYETYRNNNAIKAAKMINERNKQSCLSYILAYDVLKKRKESYDIEKLNKINAKTYKLEKELKTKGFTV